jgi:hypothetical protein
VHLQVLDDMCHVPTVFTFTLQVCSKRQTPDIL